MQQRLCRIAASVLLIMSCACGALASTSSLQFLGFVPDVGQAKDVAIDAQTNLAYVASEQYGLSVVDLTNPQQPVAIDATTPAFYGEHVAVGGSLAVVMSGSSGLTVVDISNARQQPPRAVGYLLGMFHGGTIAGNRAYIAQTVAGNPARTDLIIVDLSIPANPQILGRVSIGTSNVIALKIIGTFAYVAAGGGGLVVADVSNPTTPSIVSSVATPGAAIGVDVANGYAYVGASTAMVVVDVHTPARPFIAATLATAASNVLLAGNTLYAFSGTQVAIISVSSPTTPSVLSSSLSNFNAQGLGVLGSYLCLASPDVNTTPGTSRGGLYVVDASVPQSPQVLTNIYDGFNSAGSAADGALAVATGGNWGLRVVNINNASAPVVIGSMSGIFGNAAMAGSFAYVLQTVPGNPSRVDVDVVDLRIPSQPAISGHVTVTGSASGIAIAGSFAYVAAGNEGLHLVDVSSPSNPRVVGTLATATAAATVAVGGSYAYVGTANAILVVDIRTPTQPALVGSVSTPATAVATVGQLVYAIDGSQLKVINVATPTSPMQIGTLSTTAQALSATGTWLVLATPTLSHTDPSGGVYLVDASTPTQPNVVDQMVVPGTTRAVTIANNLVYVGDSASTIDILAINAAMPTPTSTPLPIATSTSPPTPTVTATFTPTRTQTLTQTPTQTPTWTGTPASTATLTPTPTSTPLPIATSTSPPTPTVTATFTFTPTRTQTLTQTSTQTPTWTGTPASTATLTPTPTLPSVISCPLLGDANNDGCVTITDYSILATTFGKCMGNVGFDARADFNGSGCVDLIDFSLLTSDYGLCGPIACTPSALPVKALPGQAAIGNLGGGRAVSQVTLGMVAPLGVRVGDVFEVQLQVEAGQQAVDGAAAYVRFNPQRLQVEEVVTTGAPLGLELMQQVDSTAGTVDYAAGTLQDFPSGTFRVATLRLRALRAGTTRLVLNPRQSDVTWDGASVLRRRKVFGTVKVNRPLPQQPVHS